MWKATDDGWLYISKQGNPDLEYGLLWEDSYIKLWIDSDGEASHYLLTIDGRRAYNQILDYNWIGLFFGEGDVRRNLKGRTLWNDRNVVLTRYGSNPRSYVLVAKREKEDG